MSKTPRTAKTPEPAKADWISIRNAREHNLKQVSLDLPRNALGVITGVSGSGKSSLAFDTIFKEGQRRYLASMSAYARQFMGQMERPAVDLIEGLSPTICIDQKTAGRNPRSTVGTVTEVYDFLRLLYARLGIAYCPKGHGPIEAQNSEAITDHILRDYAGQPVLILAPVIRERKGEYRKEIETIESKGYLRVRIDGTVHRLDDETSRKSMLLGRYEKHTIEVVMDRLKITADQRTRLNDAIHKALDLTAQFSDSKSGASLLAVCLHVPEEPSSRPGGSGEPGGGKAKSKSKMEKQSDRDSQLRYRIFGTSHSCATCGFSVPEMEPRLFSFNVPQGACPECDGLGQKQEFDPKRMVKDPEAAIFDGALYVLNGEGHVLFMGSGRAEIARILKAWKVDPQTPWKKIPAPLRTRLLEGKGMEKDGIDFSIIGTLTWIYEKYNIGLLERYMHIYACPECEGKRLNPVARNVLMKGEPIWKLSDASIHDLKETIDRYSFSKNEKPVAEPILREIRERLGFLVDVGLDYLTLSRRANTLSGGEAQRIRLASQVGSGLEGCLYILDEPSIGLHQRDNKKLLKTLKTLRDRGNTVYVIEHDEETMLHADHLVDVGPAAGLHGGEIVYSGTPFDLLKGKHPSSSTRAYLTGETSIPVPENRRAPRHHLVVSKASVNNLKNLTVSFPVGIFTCVTGVSGSGKSTLVQEVLQQCLSDHFEGRPLSHDLKGMEHLDKVIELDQRPIGRTPRSNPATYTGAMDFIRDLFAGLPESRVRGFDKGRFSFNRSGGRCDDCGGAGVTVVDMQLFGDAETICETCDGKRFNPATLDVHFKGHNIHEILEMSCEEALACFKDIPKLNRLLSILCDLGMGYVKLGQPSTTLSGGEAQRIKLATELGKRSTGKTCYILDEPTTGLHFDDIRKLLMALHNLVEQGNTVIVIEHNLDVIKSADHVMELGPGGGALGGKLIAQGTPESLAKTDTPTGQELLQHLERHHARTRTRDTKKWFEKEIQEDRPERAPTLLKTETWTEPALQHREMFEKGRLALRGLTKHNLKGIDLDLPRNHLITITGLSGSGKTSLAFDTIFQEGQRKYVESLSTYARRFLGRIPRAEADAISGMSPTIAVDQKAGSRNPRSTLATQTEIYDGFRVLWSTIGVFHDPATGRVLKRHSPQDIAQILLSEYPGETIVFYAPLFDSTSKRPTILDHADRIFPYFKPLQEKGYTRVEINGEIVRLDEEQVPSRFPSGKIKTCHLVLDRFEIREPHRGRILEVAEKAYDLGEGILWTLHPDSRRRGWARHWVDFDSDFSYRQELTPRHFSFNHHSGACPKCQGIGLARALSEKKFIEDADAALLKGAIYKKLAPFFTRRGQFYGSLLKRAARHAGIDIWNTPWKKLSRSQMDHLLHGSPLKDPYEARSKFTWKGIGPILEDLYAKSDSERFGPAFAHVIDLTLCPTCHGGRLDPALLSVRVDGKAIHEVSRMTVREAVDFFQALPKKLSPRHAELVHEVLDEVQFRLRHLDQLGLHYLTLDRAMGTLSGGESQRVRLSTQIGNKLKDVIYILDEPTIGLHERETEQLLHAIQELKERGNTVILVEHDARVIAESDWIVDMGPGAGHQGGNITYSGPYDISGQSTSKASFSRFMKQGGETIASWRHLKSSTQNASAPHILMPSVQQHNLHGVEIRLPTEALVGISGVSGSGKSSLMDWFVPRIRHRMEARGRDKGAKDEILFVQQGKVLPGTPFSRVNYVDQSPVTASMRSTAASYIEIWDAIRQVFSKTRDAKSKGLDYGAFSFNTPRGRCPACEGAGSLEIEMHFISDVSVVCDTCNGTRYRKDILTVSYKGRNISEVLTMTFAEARAFFDGVDRITRGVQFLIDAGLGYLQLGLNTNFLSGGELQRLKLAKELSSGNSDQKVLYLLDEPTTGLHLADVELLVGILDRLVARGHTVVVIEHNRELLRNCDFILDLGPEGGPEGGKVVAQGTVEEVRKSRKGHTWKYL